MIGDHTPGTNKHSAAYGKSLVVCATPCVLRRATAINNTGSAAWLFIFDAATLPDAGTLPHRTPIPVAAGSVNGDDWFGRGTRMAVGCVLALSSTIASLTLIATDDAWFDSEVAT